MRPESPFRRRLTTRRAGRDDRRGRGPGRRWWRRGGRPLDGGVELKPEGGCAPHPQAAAQLAFEEGSGALEAGEGVIALLGAAEVGDEDIGGAEVGTHLHLGDGDERPIKAGILEVTLNEIADLLTEQLADTACAPAHGEFTQSR